MAATARPARKEPKVRNQRALGIRGRPRGPVPIPALQGEGGAQRGHRQFREDCPSSLAPVAGALAAAGQYQHAEEIARTITDPRSQAVALAQVAGALASVGQHEHAEAIARSSTRTDWRAVALARVAEGLASAGQHQHAQAIARQAEAAARSNMERYSWADTLAEVAGALAAAGQYEHAEEVARIITDPHAQAVALARVAGALASAGQHQHAEAIARQAEAAARSITTDSRTDWQAVALARLAEELATAGQYQRAQAVAHSITDPDRRAVALARVAEVLAAGHARLARRVAAAACASGRWTAAVRPALLLDPLTCTAALIRALDDVWHLHLSP